jgi:hypothetical protein
MSAEIINLTTEVFLPEINKGWIPLDGLSVPHLFQFTRYPPQEKLYYNYPDLNQLLHEEETTILDPQILLHIGPPPQKLINNYKAAIKKAFSPPHSFTLVPFTGDPVKLPIWVLDYWREIQRVVGYHCNWRGVCMAERNLSVRLL